MPSEKAQRSAERKYQRNRPVRRRARTLVSKAERIIRTSNFDQAEIDVREATSALDSAAGKGIIHPNNAARRKSRLMKKLSQAKVNTSSEETTSGKIKTTRSTGSRSRRPSASKAN